MIRLRSGIKAYEDRCGEVDDGWDRFIGSDQKKLFLWGPSCIWGSGTTTYGDFHLDEAVIRRHYLAIASERLQWPHNSIIQPFKMTISPARGLRRAFGRMAQYARI